jgi:hypothetical protein
LRFSTFTEPATWCVSGVARVARVREPADASWATDVPTDRYTVYVAGKVVPLTNFRVEARQVLVCVPQGQEVVVLVYGPDSKGRPAEFESKGALKPP